MVFLYVELLGLLLGFRWIRGTTKVSNILATSKCLRACCFHDFFRNVFWCLLVVLVGKIATFSQFLFVLRPLLWGLSQVFSFFGEEIHPGLSLWSLCRFLGWLVAGFVLCLMAGCLLGGLHSCDLTAGWLSMCFAFVGCFVAFLRRSHIEVFPTGDKNTKQKTHDHLPYKRPS